MRNRTRGLAVGAALALVALTGGCYGMRNWEDVLDSRRRSDGIRRSEVQGYVERVERSSRLLYVESSRGRSYRIRYSSGTPLYRGNRRLQMSALERGDYVSVRVSSDYRGGLAANRVVLHSRGDDRRGSVGERRRTGRDERDDRYDDRDDRYDDRDDRRGEMRTLEGRVERIQRSAQTFEVRTSRGRVVVRLRPDPSRDLRERFARIDNGDYVRLEGRYRDSGSFVVDRIR